VASVHACGPLDRAPIIPHAFALQVSRILAQRVIQLEQLGFPACTAVFHSVSFNPCVLEFLVCALAPSELAATIMKRHKQIATFFIFQLLGEFSCWKEINFLITSLAGPWLAQSTFPASLPEEEINNFHPLLSSDLQFNSRVAFSSSLRGTIRMDTTLSIRIGIGAEKYVSVFVEPRSGIARFEPLTWPAPISLIENQELRMAAISEWSPHRSGSDRRPPL
jgi:hypothetical protein